jgi:carbon starvation protein
MAGTAEVVTTKITALGFPVTPTQMSDLAASVGEKTMIGRTGGAPTFAVGMAHIFAGVIGSKAALALWYHFAIMFEALFILTTIDAGTRVGKFLVQDLLGTIWKPLGDTRSVGAGAFATALFVAGWGWFLYQGVVDPLGGINSLWPIFGIANQLLAVLALALGTTVLIKMGRVRHLWVTLVPFGWLLSVTMTAGWMKIFSPAPLGFLAIARGIEQRLAMGVPRAEAVALRAQLFNNQVDAVVTGVFLILVATVVVANVRVWVQLLAGERAPEMREEPYVAVTETAKA